MAKQSSKDKKKTGRPKPKGRKPKQQAAQRELVATVRKKHRPGRLNDVPDLLRRRRFRRWRIRCPALRGAFLREPPCRRSPTDAGRRSKMRAREPIPIEQQNVIGGHSVTYCNNIVTVWSGLA